MSAPAFTQVAGGPGALSRARGRPQMIKVNIKTDTLDEENAKFDQVPLKQPLFLNSVPKCGSHLLRNIMRMFVPVEHQYSLQFIQHQILREHLGAFRTRGTSSAGAI